MRVEVALLHPRVKERGIRVEGMKKPISEKPRIRRRYPTKGITKLISEKLISGNQVEPTSLNLIGA